MLEKTNFLNDAELENVVGGNGGETQIKCDGCVKEFSPIGLVAIGTKHYCTKCYSKLSSNSYEETGDGEDASGKGFPGKDPICSSKFMTALKGEKV